MHVDLVYVMSHSVSPQVAVSLVSLFAWTVHLPCILFVECMYRHLEDGNCPHQDYAVHNLLFICASKILMLRSSFAVFLCRQNFVSLYSLLLSGAFEKSDVALHFATVVCWQDL